MAAAHLTDQIEIAASWRGRVDRSAGPNGCWPWTGSFVTNGYGQSRIKENGVWRTAGAHQIANYLATGVWERKSAGRLVRHLCHNRPCCNPSHLVGGTHADNMEDRMARRRGESLLAHGPAKLRRGTPSKKRLTDQALAAWCDLQISVERAALNIDDTELVTRLRAKLVAAANLAFPDLSGIAVGITRDFLLTVWRWVSEPMRVERSKHTSLLLGLAGQFDLILSGALA